MELKLKLWKVTIFESEEGWGKSELYKIYFNEENHREAREYVERMRVKTDDMTPEYYWYIDDPVLVDSDDMLNRIDGLECLDHIRDNPDADNYLP